MLKLPRLTDLDFAAAQMADAIMGFEQLNSAFGGNGFSQRMQTCWQSPLEQTA